jgi:DNA-binding XRE family transcriptional regulator
MMSDIDQTSIIEQLVAENAALREVLRHSPDKEIQIAAAVNMVIDELTRLGPNATQRVLLWAFSRYGISQHIYAREIRDRRPKEKEIAAAPAKQKLPPPENVQLPVMPAPVVIPTPPTEREIRGAQLRERRMGCGLSQAHLAEKVGIRQTDISEIERGIKNASEDRWALLWKAVEAAP